MRFLSTLAASVLGTLLAFGLILFFLFFFLFALSLSTDTSPTVQPGSVLVVPIEGTIPERTSTNPFQQAFGESPEYTLYELQKTLRNARVDDRIDAVWLRLKGTSAGWGTLEEVRQAVDELSQSDVPVIASSEEFGMAEKDYYVATAADSIFTAPQSTFEYNGLATILLFFHDAFEKLDVEPELVRAGQYKSAGESFTRSDLSEANRRQLEALLATVNDEFLATTGAARSRSVDALQTLAEEDAVLTAEAAREEGLVDELRYEDEILSLFRNHLDLREGVEVPRVSLRTYRHIPAENVGRTYTGTGHVAVIHAEGNIVTGDPNENPFGPSDQVVGSTTLIEALDQARTSSSTQAVVLRINSPGGSAAASEAMWRAVQRTAQEKPLIVSMGDVAASGGYYIAAPADSIVANATTTTGSIGVFGLLWNAQGLFEDNLGVTSDDVSTSPYADMYTPFKPLDPQERRLFGETIDQIYDVFLQRVAEGRTMDTSAVHDVAQGRVWSGRDAQNVGLVDTTGTLEDAIGLAGQAAEMGEGPYRTRILPRPKPFFEQLSEGFGTQASQLWSSIAGTPLDRTLWYHKRAIQRLAGPSGSVQARLPVRPRFE